MFDFDKATDITNKINAICEAIEHIDFTFALSKNGDNYLLTTSDTHYDILNLITSDTIFINIDDYGLPTFIPTDYPDHDKKPMASLTDYTKLLIEAIYATF